MFQCKRSQNTEIYWSGCKAVVPIATSLSYVDNVDFGSTYSQNAIVNKSIRTASMSYTNSSNPDIYEHLVMDDFAYRRSYPVFCNLASNDFTNVVNGGNYNSISVGNVQHY